MENRAKVLKIQDLETVYLFEQQKYKNLPEAERMFLEWKSSWRKESLEHYLNLSWSMATYDESGVLQGYFLAQPFLFTEGLTQTLWIEHLSYKSDSVAEELLDLIYRYARDKHLQRVLFNSNEDLNHIAKKFKFSNESKNYFEVYTTKLETP
jgi:hypothetical protein